MFDHVDPALAWGVFVWLLGLTFLGGRLYERVENIVKRLASGDKRFKEIADEQRDVAKALVELTTIKKIEVQRLALLERQVAHLWHRREAAGASPPPRRAEAQTQWAG